MRSTTNLELRESNPDGTEGAGLSHSAEGLVLLHVTEVAEGGEPTGGVTVVHGAGDHGARYADFADRLATDGWAVSVPDLRGHGETEGERGHCNGLPEVIRDLDSIQDHLTIFAPGMPLALVGQGLGGLFTLAYLIQNPGRVRTAVVLSPTLSPHFHVPEKKSGLAAMFKRVKPTTPGTIGHTPDAMFADAGARSAWTSDPLVHDVATVRTGEVVQEVAQLVKSRASEIDVPVLLLHGADDGVASVEESRALAGGNVEVRVIDGCKHDLLHDAKKDEVEQTIRDWLKSKLPL